MKWTFTSFDRNRLILLFTAALLLSVLNCSSLKKLAIRQPEAKITGVQLENLSLQELALLFHVRVSNPNPVGISLAGFDYQLKVNDRSFLSGETAEQFSVPANGVDTVQIPLALPWWNLFSLARELNQADSTRYFLEGGLIFDLPVIGKTRIPVQHRGKFPLPQIPNLRIEKILVKRFSFSGADLVLQVRLENKNPFPLLLQKMQYKIKVNGLELINGTLEKLTEISPDGTNRLVIPAHLDFLSMGQVVASALSENQTLDYEVNGRFFISDSAKSNGERGLPFQYRGKVKLIK